VLNRNRRLWWSQQKKDVNDVNLQFDNGQSGHGPPRVGAWPDWPPPGSASDSRYGRSSPPSLFYHHDACCPVSAAINSWWPRLCCHCIAGMEQHTTSHPNCFILHLLSATTEDTSVCSVLANFFITFLTVFYDSVKCPCIVGVTASLKSVHC